MFWYIFIIFSAVKLLFVPAYRSTDFEVHRNWLAITHSLPVSQWYYESTSEWTLDYPPFFAWFEYVLSQFAQYFDPEMLKVSNLNYASQSTILFQRLSVIVTDIVLALGTKECCTYLSKSKVRKSSKWSSKWQSPTTILQILLIGNAGLLMIDHIHFQYNGFLFGILLLSIANMLQGNCLKAAIYFCILLNLKHIFIYIAPSYFIYLLRNYCFTSVNPGYIVDINTFSKNNCLKLGVIVISIFSLSFGPFMYQIPQLLLRLFPFKRGLSHSYWAPNFWAVYNTADKVLEFSYRKMGYNFTSSVSSTKGLVEDFTHLVLPKITPNVTFFLTVCFMTPCLIKLWKCPGNPLHFLRCLILSALCSFIFGYHVHEKAILMSIIPLTLMSVIWQKEAQIYLVLSITGCYSFFPLFFTSFEIPIKVLLLVIHCLYSFINLSFLYDEKHNKNVQLPLLSSLESVYIFGFILLFLVDVLFIPLFGIDKKLPFLNLLLTSLYCSVGILYCFFKYYWQFLTMSEINHKRKAH